MLSKQQFLETIGPEKRSQLEARFNIDFDNIEMDDFKKLLEDDRADLLVKIRAYEVFRIKK